MINGITINRNSKGLGRPLDGFEHYSGLLYYDSGVTVSTYEQIFSVEQLTGTESDLVELVEDYFRYNEQGVLFVGRVGTTASYDYEELSDLQEFGEGRIHQALVYNQDEDLSATTVGALQLVCDSLAANDRPLSAILSNNVSETALGDLPDLVASGRNRVSNTIAKDVNKNVDASGALLGCISAAKISTSIAYVAEFNLTKGAEYAEIELLTGESLVNVNDTELEALKTKGYIPIRSFTDFNGRYFLDSRTMDSSDSDFVYIEAVRVVDEVARQARRTLLPNVNAPILLNEAGQLSEGVISFFEGEVSDVLDQFVNDQDLSDYNVIIDPTQDIASSSTLEITLQLLPVSTSRFITINLGYVLSVA